MDHPLIEEHNIAEHYLLGRLDEEAKALFEEHFLDCPECLERLELGRRLQQGLKDVTAEDSALLARTTAVAWLLRRNRAGVFLGGLALLALVIWPWLSLTPKLSQLAEERGRLETELGRALSPTIQRTVLTLSPERSATAAEPSTQLTLGPAPEWIVLALALPPRDPDATHEDPRFRVRLLSADTGEALWQSETLTGDSSNRLTVTLHSSWLEAMDYSVRLDELTPGGAPRATSRFSVRVRHAP